MNSKATAHSVVEASARSKWVSGAIVVFYALVTITPLLWIVLTSQTPTDSIAYPPTVISEPSLEGHCNLFTIRSRQAPEYMASLLPATGNCDKIARDRYVVIAGPLLFLAVFGAANIYVKVLNKVKQR